MSSARREKVTRALAAGVDGSEDLLPLVYDELRALARSFLHRERPGHTLQATALVHEAYLKLVDRDRVDFQGRTHFFAVAARSMRRYLIDHARARGRRKRGGSWRRVTLGSGASPDAASLSEEDLLAVDRALERLAVEDPREARVVELRFFAGLDMEEIAESLGVSKRTVESDWTHARAWLQRELATP